MFRSRATRIRAILAASAAVLAVTGTVTAFSLNADASTSAAGTCQLGNGVSHVVEITFDNVHLFRDNPNVPSDLELMPHLKGFLEQNGTLCPMCTHR